MEYFSGNKCPTETVHVQDVKQHILHMFRGTFLLGTAQILTEDTLKYFDYCSLNIQLDIPSYDMI